ncbi:MAG: phage Gp37/Gp68 family protein [Puniceicoccaceae bacterium]
MEKSRIEWCDSTFNPWIGCTKVSPGCAHCYAEQLMDHRLGQVEWGRGNPRKRTSAANWAKVERWDDLAKRGRFVECSVCGRREFRKWHGAIPPGGLACCTTEHCLSLPETETFRVRPRVFVASLADWLDDEIPAEWLADLLGLIRKCEHLDFLLLTKRPHLWRERLSAVTRLRKHPGRFTTTGVAVAMGWLVGPPPENVWIGTSVEDQTRAAKRISELMRIPARVRFLSCEPLLGQVDLDLGAPKWRTADSYHSEIHWVICGGESGPKARPMETEWAESLRDQCEAASISFFMKQMGGRRKPLPEIPEGLQIRQFPEVQG